jgi:hypothetical protein
MPDDASPPAEENPTRDGAECRPASDYEVGCGKPPPYTRFKKGQSGNPFGRPSHHPKLATVFDEILEEKVTIIENGRRRQITKREAILRQYLNRALQGDNKATQILTRLMSRGGAESELGQEPFTVLFIGDDARP